MRSEEPFCNGVLEKDGSYLAAPDLEALGEALKGSGSFRLGSQGTEHADFGLIDDADAEDLSLAGWGVVFPQDVDAEVRKALAPLLELRKRQAAGVYREFVSPLAYRRGQSPEAFLRRLHGDIDALVDPSEVPYYLLLVGDDDEIPLDFQYEMDFAHAVGRVHFATPAEYASYAATVVAAEQRRHARQATVFGVRNGAEANTCLLLKHLVVPLAQKLSQRHPEWSIEQILRVQATRERLAAAFDRAPSLLFTVSHGLCFPDGHPRRLAEQGAIVCSDWPGTGPVSLGTYLGGADVPDDADLRGMLMFQFSCFSAATPSVDAFAGLGGLTPFAPPKKTFFAELPRRLLSLPEGRGAQAVIAHVDRIWRYSFFDSAADLGRDRVFTQVLSRLLKGGRVGHAMDHINHWYASYAIHFEMLLSKYRQGGEVAPAEIARTWLIAHDARNFVVLGDPAARLRLA